MADVKVDISQENAILLLDAAEKDKQDVGVVRTSDSKFVVDEALAKKAGVEYVTEADEEKEFAKALAADDEASGHTRKSGETAVKKTAAKKTASAKE